MTDPTPMVEALLGKTPEFPDPAEYPSQSPQYQAWREGYRHGQLDGWLQAKHRIIRHFERLMRKL